MTSLSEAMSTVLDMTHLPGAQAAPDTILNGANSQPAPRLEGRLLRSRSVGDVEVEQPPPQGAESLFQFRYLLSFEHIGASYVFFDFLESRPQPQSLDGGGIDEA